MHDKGVLGNHEHPEQAFIQQIASFLTAITHLVYELLLIIIRQKIF